MSVLNIHAINITTRIQPSNQKERHKVDLGAGR